MGRPAGARRWPATARLLLAANLVLLGVVWFVSISVYDRLPQRVLSWSSLWRGHPVLVERSWTFYLYPIAQVVLCAAWLGLAEIFFLRTPRRGGEIAPPDPAQVRREGTLRREVVYLALIFFNLLFIHLQTSLILLSREIGPGINRPYFVMLLAMLLFIPGPYYRMRLKAVRSTRAGSPGPR
jgi:hypothetical protein